jgi:tRNA dimethylallyltransferase
MVATKKPEILVIVGETASGKSDLALRIAKDFNGEIISADSWLVYRDFNIGTAKPSVDERKQVRHHLIDIVGAQDGFSAPLFQQRAVTAIKDIQKRGKLPIVVGGTGLYIDSLIFDYGFLPNVGEAERARLNQKTISELIEEAKSEKIDLSNIDIRNKRRIIRAIEAKGQKPTKKGLEEEFLVVGMQLPREELRRKVEKRVAKMLVRGLEQEVKKLANKYDWQAEPMKGIGYREFKKYFSGEQNLEQTRERIISSTLNLAKRQRTWFKRHKFIRWYSSVDEAYEGVSQLLNK